MKKTDWTEFLRWIDIFTAEEIEQVIIPMHQYHAEFHTGMSHIAPIYPSPAVVSLEKKGIINQFKLTDLHGMRTPGAFFTDKYMDAWAAQRLYREMIISARDEKNTTE